MRIGHGYDVHKLVENRPLIIGGVNIPYKYGLLGHSDADVLTHAIMDAIIGALALGDIGKHFSDMDSKYQNISSLKLAEYTAQLLLDNNMIIENIDATVIAQNPKIAQYTNQMRLNLAKIYNIDMSQINIKATTEEGLGFTGIGEGISTHAICLLKSAANNTYINLELEGEHQGLN